MKLFDKLKKTNNLEQIVKILDQNNLISVPKDNNHNTFGQVLDHLDSDGELPFGWIAHNREFTNKIENEFSYFLNQWITCKDYASLKSLIQYIEDAQKLCKSKSECHVKWFSDCVADQEYLEKRKFELQKLNK